MAMDGEFVKSFSEFSVGDWVLFCKFINRDVGVAKVVGIVEAICIRPSGAEMITDMGTVHIDDVFERRGND